MCSCVGCACRNRSRDAGSEEANTIFISFRGRGSRLFVCLFRWKRRGGLADKRKGVSNSIRVAKLEGEFGSWKRWMGSGLKPNSFGGFLLVSTMEGVFGRGFTDSSRRQEPKRSWWFRAGLLTTRRVVFVRFGATTRHQRFDSDVFLEPITLPENGY